MAADVQPADGSGASSGFVFDEAAQERLSNILADYQGTHNFHNFTVRMSPTDPSAKRYILNFSCAGVQMIEVSMVCLFLASWVLLENVGSYARLCLCHVYALAL